MAIDKQLPVMNGEIPPTGDPLPIEIELELPEGEQMMEEEIPQPPQFNENLAEFLDDSVLAPLASELTSLYEEDKESRQEWYEAFSSGLDLLGIKSQERTQPFPVV